ncbi:MAG: PD40 domain-containing protein [Sedimentisphaerales bacterium]|nr:PD40 domain-containing protein [Sedimentisphaerales bacterium]
MITRLGHFASFVKKGRFKLITFLMTFSVIFVSQCQTSPQSRSIFDNNSDVGPVTHTGTAQFNQSSKKYRITGGGKNIWGQKDAFQYLWKKDSGDFCLTTKIRWVGDGKNAHRKAGWMIRQSLTTDSVYADAVIHGDGLTSLQFRKTKGGQTEEIQSPVSAPDFIRIERYGDVFSLYISKDGKQFQPVGSVSVALADPVYLGLIVCSHDDTTTETAIFSKVDFKSLGIHKMEDRTIESSLEIISVETGQRRIVYSSDSHFEAPNWFRDGKSLLFNSDGRLYTIPITGGKPMLLNTDFADRCNNDHGFSPDGKLLAISDQHEGESLIYVLPDAGGTPRKVTELGPSYWHGWSPEGKTLAYCAERNGNYDIYTIPVEGGRETRLTDDEGLDDGPEYSPDGRYIYFNSERTGAMKIWRMDSDGTNQTQITNDDQYADWFPHPSPDGKQIVFLSYDKEVKGHPANKDVALRIMPSSGEKPRVLTRLFGGQGTINVPSWSPDNKYIAFVSYRLVGNKN